ncbi:MAG: hypothetical protein ABSC48_02835 [Terracidiphilus sp.]
MDDQAINFITDALNRISDKQDELAANLNEWRQEISERTSKLEAVVKPALQGNGTPSEIFQIKERVTTLEEKGWLLSGISRVVQIVGLAAWTLITTGLTLGVEQLIKHYL